MLIRLCYLSYVNQVCIVSVYTKFQHCNKKLFRVGLGWSKSDNRARSYQLQLQLPAETELGKNLAGCCVYLDHLRHILPLERTLPSLEEDGLQLLHCEAACLLLVKGPDRTGDPIYM